MSRSAGDFTGILLASLAIVLCVVTVGTVRHWLHERARRIAERIDGYEIASSTQSNVVSTWVAALAMCALSVFFAIQKSFYAVGFAPVALLLVLTAAVTTMQRAKYGVPKL